MKPLNEILTDLYVGKTLYWTESINSIVVKKSGKIVSADIEVDEERAYMGNVTFPVLSLIVHTSDGKIEKTFDLDSELNIE